MLQTTSTFVAVSMSLTVVIANAEISSVFTISVVCSVVTGFSEDFGFSEARGFDVLGALGGLVCLEDFPLLLGLLLGLEPSDLRVTRTRANSPPIPRKPALPRLMVSTSTSVRSTFSSIRASSTASSTVRALRSTVSIVYLR